MTVTALCALSVAASFGVSAFAVPASDGPSASPSLALDLRGCPAVAPGGVQGLVALELHRPVVLLEGSDPASTSTLPTVRVVCESMRAAIEVDDPFTGKKIERVVDLAAAAPVARPHLLALSVVELLATGWLELESNPQPGHPPPRPAAIPEIAPAGGEAVSAPAVAPRGPRLLAGVAAQASTAGPWSTGGGVIVAGDVEAHLGWMVDVTFLQGQRTFALGRVTADNVSALGGFFARASRGVAAIRLGVGARGGGAWLSGSPADSSGVVGGVVSGPWWGAVGIADASVTLRGRIVLELMLEGGRVVLPVIATVQGAGPVAIDGAWMRGGIGVGFTM
jgi:hypothetical protein